MTEDMTEDKAEYKTEYKTEDKTEDKSGDMAETMPESGTELKDVYTTADKTENEAYWMFLSSVEGLGDAQTDKLLAQLGTAEGIYRATEDELRAVPGVRPEVIDSILDRRARIDPVEEYARVTAMGISYVSRQHPDYPARLAAIGNPPNGLFYKGRLPDSTRPAVAIVGSRTCSNYGRDISLKFARELAAAGVDVISGMAAGVDGHSHRGALEGGGDTYAVLGTGVDICYPRANHDIYTGIQEHGGLISEYYPGIGGLAQNFPRRNRIISALSDGILVVEARERSGTWITVDMGLEQGKDIYVIPGRIDDELSFGCNRLIRQGARLVMSPADIIAELAPRYGFLVSREGCGDAAVTDGEGQRVNSFNAQELAVLSNLDTRPRTIEELCNLTQLEVRIVMAALAILEMKGACEMLGSSHFIKRII